VGDHIVAVELVAIRVQSARPEADGHGRRLTKNQEHPKWTLKTR
jgi:hypothetical protein